MLRSIAKGIAERALVWSGAASLRRRAMSGRLLVLAYHNVVPDDAEPVGDLPNHLPLSVFSGQLHALGNTHDVVPLADAFAQPSRQSRRPRAVITFDDAYAGAVRFGVQEVVRQGFPATIFVAPAFLGGRSFWWDALARGRSGLEARTRHHALVALRGEDAAVRRWARKEGLPISDPPPVACAASEDDLLAAAARPGIALAAHTWAHPNLTRLGPDECRDELARPLAWLRQRVATTLPWLAYPYGYFNQEIERQAAAAGYDAGLAVHGGWFPRQVVNRYSLPRLNIPRGISLRGFVIRGAGMLAG